MVTSPSDMEGYAKACAASARAKDHFGTGTESGRTTGNAWLFLIKGTLVSDRRKLRRRTARFEPNTSHSDPLSSARAIHHGREQERDRTGPLVAVAGLRGCGGGGDGTRFARQGANRPDGEG